MDGIYGFDTEDRERATAALLVYAVYRSRNRSRYRVTPDMWGQIERFTKSAAKRARTIPEFLERLKPRLACESLRPAAMAVGLSGMMTLAAGSHGELLEFGGADDEHREFLTRVVDRCDEREVLRRLYGEANWVILLVRDRLEREKPIERRVETMIDAEAS